MLTEEAINAAKSVMSAHINALNSKNGPALAATLHFPHYRLSGTELKTWETPEHYLTDFLSRAGADWNHSSFEDIQVVRASGDKVHLDAEIRRFRSDGSLITHFRSLWIITRVNGTWAAQFRSSFATL